MDERLRIIEGEQVTRHFGGLKAVQNVDFLVYENEILGLIGPNGAGKTTLFNLITGVIPVTKGSIKFKGRDITHTNTFRRSRLGISRTFQTGNLFQSLTVYENVLLASLFGSERHKNNSVARDETLNLIDFVGLSDKRNSLAKDLTLALQRRVEMARALAVKPSLLLLDEVLAGLTPSEVAQGIELINLIRERGFTIFMVEHVMKAIMGLSDRVMVLHHGEKIIEGLPTEIGSSKLVQEVYLGEEV